MNGRAFVRSWTLGRRSWREAFARDGVGALRLGGRELPVAGLPVADPALNDAVDGACRHKDQPAPEVEDTTGAGSGATTLELAARRA